MQKKISGIYRIRNTITDEIYVGSSIHIYSRFKGHRASLRAGRHHSSRLQNSWNKYGSETFVYEIVEVLTGDYDALRAKEQEYIDTLLPAFNMRKLVVDVRGHTPSAETRQKISQAARNISPKTREKMAAAKRGGKASIETREKMRLAKVGLTKDPTSYQKALDTRNGRRLAAIKEQARTAVLTSKYKMPFRKFTEDQVLEIRNSGDNDLTIAYKYTCSPATIRKIRHRLTYKDI